MDLPGGISMTRVVWAVVCVATVACSASKVAPKVGTELSDSGERRMWDEAVGAADPALLARTAREISESLWIRELTATAVGDRQTASALASEREAFTNEVIARAHRTGTRPLVTSVVLRREEFVRHRADVLWSLERVGRIPDATVLAARRAYAGDAATLSQLPCRASERRGCVRHFDSGDPVREAVVAAGSERDREALERALARALEKDPLDTWAGVLRLLVAEATRHDELIFALASEPEVTRNGRVAAVAVRALDAAPRSAPRMLALAQVALERNDAPDATVLARRAMADAPNDSAVETTALALLAKAALVLDDPATYLSWRDARAYRRSASLVSFEARQWLEGGRHSDVARLALTRAIELDDLSWARRASLSTDLPMEARRRAVDRLRLEDPAIAAVAETCVRGVTKACPAVEKYGARLPVTLISEIANVGELADWQLSELELDEALADPRLPDLLSRLAATRHRHNPTVARARFSRAVADGKLETAAGLLADADSGFDDLDFLSATLLLEDVRSGKTTAAGARVRASPGFVFLHLARNHPPRFYPKTPPRAWTLDDPGYARFEAANRLWFEGKAGDAYVLYRDLLRHDLPERARSELSAHAVFAALSAGQGDEAKAILTRMPPQPGSVQDDLCRAFLVLASDPGRALPSLGRAAGMTPARLGVRDAFALALTGTGHPGAREFLFSRLDARLQEGETQPELSEGELLVAARTLIDIEAAQKLPDQSPVLAYHRGGWRHAFTERVMLAKATEDIQEAAADFVKRAPPVSSTERAWLMILAGANDRALALLEENPPAAADLLVHEEAVLVATERLSPSTPFDAVVARQLWGARGVKHDSANEKRDKARPPSWSSLKPRTAAGEELMCRALMRHGQPRVAAQFCFRAWQQGRKSGRLGEHMSYLVVVEPKLTAAALIEGKSVFADEAFQEERYAYLLNKSTWLWRQPDSDRRRVATAYRDGLAVSRDTGLQQTEWQRVAIAEYYPVLARVLAEPGDSWRSYVLAVGLLAIGDGDREVVEVARAALARDSKTAVEPNGAAVLADIQDIVEEDRRQGRADRRIIVESINAMAVAFDQQVGVQAPRSEAHVAKLGAVLRSIRSMSAVSTLQLAQDLALRHPTNDTVAVAKALALCDAGRADEARAFVGARFPDPTNTRRVELLQLLDKVERARQRIPQRGAPESIES